MLYLTEPRGTLLSYAAPYWATLHLTVLRWTHKAELRPIELRCTLLSYTQNPNWATMHPTELRWTLLSYAEPYWATLYPTELHYSPTELPSVLVPLCNFVKCRNAGLSGTGIRVTQSGTGMLRYRTEMLDAGIPMPAASVSMPMPSYAREQTKEGPPSFVLINSPFISVSTVRKGHPSLVYLIVGDSESYYMWQRGWVQTLHSNVYTPKAL